MSIEAQLFQLLGSLVNNAVYPDSSPDNPSFPLVIYQQVGGDAYAYLDKTLPDHRHARIQITVWSRTRSEASTLARRIEAAVIGSALIAEAYGAFVSDYQDTAKLYGTRQDFGIWFTD